MMRAGGHAIIQWIAEHVTDGLVVFNNLNPEKIIMDHRTTPWTFGLPSRIPHFESRGRKWEWVYRQFDKMATDPIECFLYSYEDRNPELFCDEIITPQIKVVVIRDPYNWLASRLKGFGGIFPQRAWHTEPNPIGMWKKHARIAIDKPEGYLPVLYNQWFSSKEYRISLSEKLGLEHTDKGLEQISGHGGGSSFDGMTFDSQAQQMDVLSRWKEYADNTEYRQYFDDEIHEISHVVFPEMLEASEILKKKDLL